MQSAMVITGWGHEQHVREESRALVDYLKRECHMRYVADVDAVWRTPHDLQTTISIHAIRAGRQPFLLAYLGHGWRDGWYFGKEHRKKWLVLKYDWLEDLLRQREGPTLILNDTCCSGSLAERLARWRTPSEACVISATTPKGYAYGQLTPDVIESWRQRNTYVPRRRTLPSGRVFWERRVGITHDRFFFTKPA